MSDRTIITVEPAIHAFGAGKGSRVSTIEAVLYDDDIDPRTVPLGSTRLTDASRTVDFVSYFHLAAESAVRRAFDSLLTISEDAEAVGAL